MDLRKREYPVGSIASDARVETQDTYEEAISDFKAQKFTYMPFPSSQEFYHIDDSWFGDIRSEQWIEPTTHLLDAFELLCDNPFLLVTNWEDVGETEYGFINRSNINKRATREMLYPLIAEFESLIARRIKSDFDSMDLLQKLSDRTVGSWIKDEQRNVELHIAESMDLGEMTEVLNQSDERLAKSCGFESKEELEDIDGIRELRNKVMHANRSLVRNRDDIREMIETIERTQELIRKANSGAAFK